jgi:ParB-like chromosome segregation protein Spo0J
VVWHCNHKMKRRHFVWTTEEDARLRELAEKGIAAPRVAVVLGRSEKSVRRRAAALNITIRKQSRLPYADRVAF